MIARGPRRRQDDGTCFAAIFAVIVAVVYLARALHGSL